MKIGSLFMADLRRRSHTTFMMCFAVRWFVRSNGFWNTCENFLYMVMPMVKALRVFDGRALAMRLAWKVMHDLETHIREFVEPPFALSDALERMVFDDDWITFYGRFEEDISHYFYDMLCC